MWAEQGFEQAAAALLRLPRAGVDPATCPHETIGPGKIFFDSYRRSYFRYCRCAACFTSVRRPESHFGGAGETP